MSPLGSSHGFSDHHLASPVSLAHAHNLYTASLSTAQVSVSPPSPSSAAAAQDPAAAAAAGGLPFHSHQSLANLVGAAAAAGLLGGRGAEELQN